jgi:hypothetical protein
MCTIGSDTEVLIKEWCKEHVNVLVPDYCEMCSRITGIKSKSEIYGVLEEEYII